MTEKTEKKQQQYLVRMTQSGKERLDRLASESGVSRTKLVEKALELLEIQETNLGLKSLTTTVA